MHQIIPVCSVILVFISYSSGLGSEGFYRHYGPPSHPEPEPMESYEIVFPGEPVIRQHPRGHGRTVGSEGRSEDDGFYGDRSRGGRCGGLCVLPNHCASLKGTAKGFCSPTGGDSRVCCSFEKSCEESTSEMNSTFTSPGYPGAALGSLICQYDIHLQPGVCGVRLDFVDFNTTEPLDRGICNVDQFMILNSPEGAAFPRCGQLTGYSTVVYVDPRHKLPLTLLSIIQSSKETFKWSIRQTQVKCSSVRRLNNYPDCGKTYHKNETTENNESPVGITEIPTTTLTFQESDSENIIESESIISAGKSYRLSSRHSIDNAFYINYLKQAHDAIMSSINNSSTNANNTMCKNKDIQMASDKLVRYRNGEDAGEFSDDLARIILGSEAQYSEFPWQVSIQDSEDGHVCGGAIISPKVIFTAAHCFLSVAPVPISKIKVAVGDLNLNLTTEADSEYAEISSISFHSHFDPYYLGNDVALINLKKPLNFRENIQPVCLPQRGNSYVSRKAVISGWGATSYPQGKLANHLQKITTGIIENSECKEKLNIDYVYSSMMCAVGGNCSGTCFGDSGGPLVVSENGANTLVGLVSFGIGGCTLFPYWPDVYTRVSSFLDWAAYAVEQPLKV